MRELDNVSLLLLLILCFGLLFGFSRSFRNRLSEFLLKNGYLGFLSIIHLLDLVSVVKISLFHAVKGLLFIIESYLSSMFSLSDSFFLLKGVLELLLINDLLSLLCSEDRSLLGLSLLNNLRS